MCAIINPRIRLIIFPLCFVNKEVNTFELNTIPIKAPIPNTPNFIKILISSVVLKKYL